MRISSNQYRRIIQGKRNQVAGKNFEDILKAACDYYRNAGIAEIEKTPEPFHIERHIGNGKFVGHFEKQAQPDFKGTTKGGGSIVFEAKHTDTDRMSRTAVTAEQSAALDRNSKLGAACFVVVSFGFKDFFKVPWAAFRDMKKYYGRQYIKPADIEEYRIAYVGGLLILFA